MNLASLGRDLLDLLLPRACLGCGGRVPPERETGLVCAGCTAALREPPFPRCARCDFPTGTGVRPGASCTECRHWPEALTGARASAVLRPPADALVHALKYRGWADLAGPLGARVARLGVHPRVRGRAFVVVPIPTTKARARRRGYNQARLLAQVVAEATERPLVDALERRSGGTTQVSLHPAERLANVERAFSVRPNAMSRLQERPVVLVDDVLTTGATAGAAAKALARCGTDGVYLAAFARAFPHTVESR